MKYLLSLASCLVLSLFTLSCNPKAPTASINAVIATVGDTTGSGSASVIVNFTDFLASGTESSIGLTFSDPDGNVMVIELAAQSGSFPTNVSYNLDGSSNTFETTLKVFSSGNSSAVNLTSTSGYINLKGLERNGTQVLAASGEFAVTFDTSGTATGSFYARSN